VRKLYPDGTIGCVSVAAVAPDWLVPALEADVRQICRSRQSSLAAERHQARLASHSQIGDDSSLSQRNAR